MNAVAPIDEDAIRNQPRWFRHTDSGIWSAEASDLGFAPGEWPTEIVAYLLDESYDRVVTAVGTGQFVRDGEGDLLYVDYRAPGVTLRIYND